MYTCLVEYFQRYCTRSFVCVHFYLNDRLNYNMYIICIFFKEWSYIIVWNQTYTYCCLLVNSENFYFNPPQYVYNVTILYISIGFSCKLKTIILLRNLQNHFGLSNTKPISNQKIRFLYTGYLNIIRFFIIRQIFHGFS